MAARPSSPLGAPSLGPQGLGPGRGPAATTLSRGAPRSRWEPGAEAGTGSEPALLQSRGLNRALGANHSAGGAGGGGGLGWRGGARLPHSPRPPPPTPPPRLGGAVRRVPRDLRQAGWGVGPREGAGSAAGPARTPLRCGVAGGE